MRIARNAEAVFSREVELQAGDDDGSRVVDASGAEP